MKYMITGSRGQLGQDISILLKNTGAETIDLTHTQLDISKIDQVSKITKGIKPDVVINCAAFNHVDLAEKLWEGAYRTNAEGSRNLALISEELNIPLIHFSTHFVFNGKGKDAYKITDQPDPINTYGKSKLLGEEIIRSTCRRFIIIRVSWLFGDRGKANVNFAKKVLDLAKDQNTLKIVSDQIASPSYTKDVAKITIQLMENRAWGLYHFNNKGKCSKFEWARFILEKINWTGTIEPAYSIDFDSPALRPRFALLDNSPLNQMDQIVIPDWQSATEEFLTNLKLI
jgi:dTDP-4-dehydrorhamnose reductase